MLGAPGPHCKLSSSREPYDRNSESKPHVFIKQQCSLFRFHPIQIKYFPLSTGSLTSENMFSKCHLCKEEGARGGSGGGCGHWHWCPPCSSSCHTGTRAAGEGPTSPESPRPRAMAASGISVSPCSRAPSPEPGFTGPCKVAHAAPETGQGARLGHEYPRTDQQTARP